MGRTGRRGSEAWISGLGLGPVMLRPAEGHKLGDGAWASEVEAGGGARTGLGRSANGLGVSR